jgi:hypothetical protein
MGSLAVDRERQESNLASEFSFVAEIRLWQRTPIDWLLVQEEVGVTEVDKDVATSGCRLGFFRALSSRHVDPTLYQ